MKESPGGDRERRGVGVRLPSLSLRFREQVAQELEAFAADALIFGIASIDQRGAEHDLEVTRVAASVGAGTIALFAVAGSYGQLIAMLLFVYAGLASAGGTVPVEALPGFLRTLSSIEPLRQVLAGTRSIMYFDAQADAGLTRGTLAAAGLLFWLVLGTAIVKWYDRRHLYRLHPDLLAHVSKSVQDYKAAQPAPAPVPAQAPAPAEAPAPGPGPAPGPAPAPADGRLC